MVLISELLRALRATLVLWTLTVLVISLPLLGLPLCWRPRPLAAA